MGISFRMGEDRMVVNESFSISIIILGDRFHKIHASNATGQRTGYGIQSCRHNLKLNS